MGLETRPSESFKEQAMSPGAEVRKRMKGKEKRAGSPLGLDEGRAQFLIRGGRTAILGGGIFRIREEGKTKNHEAETLRKKASHQGNTRGNPATKRGQKRGKTFPDSKTETADSRSIKNWKDAIEGSIAQKR